MYVYDKYLDFWARYGDTAPDLNVSSDTSGLTEAGFMIPRTSFGHGESVEFIDDVHSNEWPGRLETMAIGSAARKFPDAYNGLGIRTTVTSLDRDGQMVQQTAASRGRYSPSRKLPIALNQYLFGMVRPYGSPEQRVDDRACGFRNPHGDKREVQFFRQKVEDQQPRFARSGHHGHAGTGYVAYVSDNAYNETLSLALERISETLGVDLSSTDIDGDFDTSPKREGIQAITGKLTHGDLDEFLTKRGTVTLSNDIHHFVFRPCENPSSANPLLDALSSDQPAFLATLTRVRDAALQTRPTMEQVRTQSTRQQRIQLLSQFLITNAIENYVDSPPPLPPSDADPVGAAQNLFHAQLLQTQQFARLADATRLPDEAKTIRKHFNTTRTALGNLVDARTTPFPAIAAGGLLSTFAVLGQQIGRPLDVEHACNCLARHGLVANTQSLLRSNDRSCSDSL